MNSSGRHFRLIAVLVNILIALIVLSVPISVSANVDRQAVTAKSQPIIKDTFDSTALKKWRFGVGIQPQVIKNQLQLTENRRAGRVARRAIPNIAAPGDTNFKISFLATSTGDTPKQLRVQFSRNGNKKKPEVFSCHFMIFPKRAAMRYTFYGNTTQFWSKGKLTFALLQKDLKGTLILDDVQITSEPHLQLADGVQCPGYGEEIIYNSHFDRTYKNEYGYSTDGFELSEIDGEVVLGELSLTNGGTNPGIRQHLWHLPRAGTPLILNVGIRNATNQAKTAVLKLAGIAKNGQTETADCTFTLASQSAFTYALRTVTNLNYQSMQLDLNFPDLATDVLTVSSISLKRDMEPAQAATSCSNSISPAPDPEWAELYQIANAQYQATYNNDKPTNVSAYYGQLECIARDLSDIGQNAYYSRANGAIKAVFDYTYYTSPTNGSDVDVSACLPIFTGAECMAILGSEHAVEEIYEGFLQYCLADEVDYGQWDKEHTSFLNTNVAVCMDERVTKQEIDGFWRDFLIQGILECAKTQRDYAQKDCTLARELSEIYQAPRQEPIPVPMPADAGLELPGNSPRIPIFQCIDLSKYAGLLTLQIHTPDNQATLSVGQNIQLAVLRGAENVTSPSTGTSYMLAADSGYAQLSANGLLSITGTPRALSHQVYPITIIARNGTDIGIAQFGIVDVDTDGDRMVDSYELKTGLNPLIANPITLDSDGDRIADVVEAIALTHPLNAASFNPNLRR